MNFSLQYAVDRVDMIFKQAGMGRRQGGSNFLSCWTILNRKNVLLYKHNQYKNKWCSLHRTFNTWLLFTLKYPYRVWYKILILMRLQILKGCRSTLCSDRGFRAQPLPVPFCSFLAFLSWTWNHGYIKDLKWIRKMFTSILHSQLNYHVYVVTPFKE